MRGAGGEPVHSVRDIEIVEPSQVQATASSTCGPAYKAENAVDGDSDTYWSSEFKDDAWLALDLGTVKKLGRVRIEWETAFAKSFAVQVFTDGKNWTGVYRTDDGKGGVSEIKFTPVQARQVRLLCTKRGTQWRNAVREMRVFEK